MAKPKALEIRGYNVGFGDCFLLTFDYGKTKKHVEVQVAWTMYHAGTSSAKRVSDTIKDLGTADPGFADSLFFKAFVESVTDESRRVQRRQELDCSFAPSPKIPTRRDRGVEKADERAHDPYTPDVKFGR